MQPATIVGKHPDTDIEDVTTDALSSGIENIWVPFVGVTAGRILIEWVVGQKHTSWFYSQQHTARHWSATLQRDVGGRLPSTESILNNPNQAARRAVQPVYQSQTVSATARKHRAEARTATTHCTPSVHLSWPRPRWERPLSESELPRRQQQGGRESGGR